MSTLFKYLVVLTVVGCGAPGEDEYPPRLDQQGDPCRANYAICLDNETALECIDGSWTDQSCDESCAKRGPALRSQGCADAPSEGCVCVPEPGSCAPGSTACESDTELGYCDTEQVWGIYACADLCAASLATPVSLGCDLGADGTAACWCAAEDPG